MRREILETARCPASGSRLAVDARESRGEDITYGILTGESDPYPIVAGVPILLPGFDHPVELIRRGRHDEATVAALWQQLPPSRLRRIALALDLLRPGSSPTPALERRDRSRLGATLAPLLDGDDPDPLPLLRFAFEGWGAANPEAASYFTYRFGTPRHLVSLSVARSLVVPAGETILDLGCGAGHLAWALDRLHPGSSVIGMDLSLVELLAARSLAPSVDLVCGDATSLPFAPGSFGAVISSDVLSFVRDKARAVREAARVLSPEGTLAVTAVKSSLHPHVYAGMPLSPDGWRGLVDPWPHRLLADRRILDLYLEGRVLDLDDPGPVDEAPTVTLLAAPSGLALASPDDVDTWPHASGPLGVNPLLRPSTRTASHVTYRRAFPTATFAADNPPLADYLPAEVTIPVDAVEGDHLDPGSVAHLVPSTAVLALPAAYRRSLRTDGGPTP